MVDVLAEDDSLVHRVVVVPVRGNAFGDELRPARKADVAVEVELVVDPIGDVPAEVVHL